MNDNNRRVYLVLVVALIIGAIWYLESGKTRLALGPGQDIAVINTSTTTPERKNLPQILADKAGSYPKGKELVDTQGFINTQPIKLSDLAGKKVILIDFWTYSCINCIRTIPYLNMWYEKYKDYGLEIVGVHTPEFDFEKKYDNVATAVKKFGIKYPVVLDSNYGTWNAYQNAYWPREYLIDIDGFIVHDHAGEGSYTETEQAIQSALEERSRVLGTNQHIPTGITAPSGLIQINPVMVQSPETYFGSERNEYLANGRSAVAGVQTLTLPASYDAGKLYLGGQWNFSPQYAENVSNGSKIVFRYDAKNVYLVGSSIAGVRLKITIDGAPAGKSAGEDVASDGTVLIKENRLYKIVTGAEYGEHTLQIEVESPGLDAYTFTFG